jgi:hypothetical protein
MRKRSPAKGKIVDSTAENRTRASWLRISLEILAIIIGLAGLAYGLMSREHRELVYAVNPIRTTIVSAEACSTDFRVSYRGEDLGCEDITSAQVAIWNRGNASIRPENVLKSIVIFTDPEVKILDASVRGYHNVETKFAIVYDKESWERGRIPVSWQILQKNDGDSIQLIYLGTSSVNIYVEGKIEGFDVVKRIDLGLAPKQGKSWTELYESQKISQIIWWTTVSLAILTILILIIDWRRGFRIFRTRISKIFWVTGCIYILAVVVTFYFTTPKFLNWPPFGF